MKKAASLLLSPKYPQAPRGLFPGGTSSHLSTQELDKEFQGWSVGQFLKLANDWQLCQAGMLTLGAMGQFTGFTRQGVTSTPSHKYPKMSQDINPSRL